MHPNSQLNVELIHSLRHLLRESGRLVNYLRQYSGAEEARRAEERHVHLETLYSRLTGEAPERAYYHLPTMPVTVGTETANFGF